AAADLIEAHRLAARAAVLADAGCGVLLDHHFAAALAQQVAQRAQRLGDFRGLFAYEGNALKRWLHWRILTVESEHAGQASTDPAEDPRRALHRRGPA